MTRALFAAMLVCAGCASNAVTVDAASSPDAYVLFDQVGDRCRPNAVPSTGFAGGEVYVELSNAQCGAGACMVFHLVGDPRCTIECAQCGGTDACSDCSGTCVSDTMGTEPNSLTRTFCTCRCSAAGNPSLPMCDCESGMRCVNDADPGGGYCVPDTL